MQRKGFGLADIIIAAIVLVLIMIMLWLGADFSGVVAERSADRSAFFEGEHARGEILSAPCATVSRGVFSLSAVQSGSLNCIDPMDEVLVTFDAPGVDQTWLVEETNSGITVQSSSETIEDPEVYRILVYSGASGSKRPGELRIGPVPQQQNQWFYGATSPQGGFMVP